MFLKIKKTCSFLLDHYNIFNLRPKKDKLRIIILIFSPPKSKLTKTCTETSRSISTFFSDDGFSERLLTADTPTTFQQMINERKEILA